MRNPQGIIMSRNLKGGLGAEKDQGEVMIKVVKVQSHTEERKRDMRREVKEKRVNQKRRERKDLSLQVLNPLLQVLY